MVLLLGLWAFWLEPAGLTFTEERIALDSITGGSIRIAVLTDLHVVPSRFGVRFTAGHVVEGGRHLFVATGIGTSILPVRFRVPPSVPILTLE